MGSLSQGFVLFTILVSLRESIAALRFSQDLALHPLSSPGRRLWFLIPGDLDTPTGGYRYDRRMLQGLTDLGWRVEHCPLDPSFPTPTPAALEQARLCLAAIGDGELVVIDGLAFGALPGLAEAEGPRLRLVALVHHPLGLETGLTPERAAELCRAEARALAQARLILVTSHFTHRLLTSSAGWGLDASRLRVVEPGIDRVLHGLDQGLPLSGTACVRVIDEPAPEPSLASAAPDSGRLRLRRDEAEGHDLARGDRKQGRGYQPGALSRRLAAARPPRLLCVATLTPRKGHDLLLRALAALRDLPWQLNCVGSFDRDPAWAEQLVRWRDELGLAGRVSFLGALSQAELDRRYRRADLFVLPSRFEGYGMVCAEALAHGLPILASRVGAIGDLVPVEAGLLVPPDDPLALEGALRRLLEDPALRLWLVRGARAAGARLPGWEAAVAAFAAALAASVKHPEEDRHG